MTLEQDIKKEIEKDPMIGTIMDKLGPHVANEEAIDWLNENCMKMTLGQSQFALGMMATRVMILDYQLKMAKEENDLWDS